jgi:hypothetical protein
VGHAAPCYAVLQGGGVFLRGLQQDKVGRGNVIVNSCSIRNNTAGFGGAVACDSCRAVFLNTNMSGNSAAFKPLAALPGSHGSTCAAAGRNGSSSGTRDGACIAAAGPMQQQSSAAGPQMGTVLGAGGAIAAVLKGRSFLHVCKGLGSLPGRVADMADNTAATTGGLVYMDQQGACGSSSGGSCSGSEETDCQSIGQSAQVRSSTTEGRAGPLAVLPPFRGHRCAWPNLPANSTGAVGLGPWHASSQGGVRYCQGAVVQPSVVSVHDMSSAMKDTQCMLDNYFDVLTACDVRCDVL